MDARYELQGQRFVWNTAKAAANPGLHDGITFEQAATVFFDPLLRTADASRHGEQRDAAIGFDARSRLLFVVHLQQGDDASTIRIISARRATHQERQDHEDF